MRLQAAGFGVLVLLHGPSRACDLPAREDLSKAAFVKPIEADLTTGFGRKWHPILQYVRPHNGIDFVAPQGEPVVATLGGRVLEAHYKGEFGNFVMIDHGAGIVSGYAHLLRWAPGVAADKCVRAGDVIGFIGQTGLSAGAHLHFEVHRDGKPIDPEPLLGLNAPAPDRSPARSQK